LRKIVAPGEPVINCSKSISFHGRHQRVTGLSGDKGVVGVQPKHLERVAVKGMKWFLVWYDPREQVDPAQNLLAAHH
jgi:hypothetical protein